MQGKDNTATDFLKKQVAQLHDGGQKEIFASLNQKFGKTDIQTNAIVTLAEAATILKRTKRTVQHLVEEGHLTAFTPAGRTRSWGITKVSLEHFIAQGSSPDMKNTEGEIL